MDQREELVRLAQVPGANKSRLCDRFGVSRQKGYYKWQERFDQEGRAGLADRSRRPHRSPNRTDAAMEAAVLEVRDRSNGAWGGRKIARTLRNAGYANVPSPSTVTAILRRHGALDERAHEHPGPCRRFERASPNELWQMDFKGHFALPAGRCHPLGVLDDHSRYALGLEACADEQEATVRGRLTAIFRRHGLPWEMLMDNGPPWGDSGDQPYTALAVWLMWLGVRVTHGRPRHPQTQGKQERFHRTLNAELLQGHSLRDLPECQRAFDRWRQIYNHDRPHEALDLATPGERYRPSPRSFPEQLPPIEYASTDHVRKVDQSGWISFRNRRMHLSKAFRGRYVALRPTDADGVFSVHFGIHHIDTLDLRTPPARGSADLANAPSAEPRADQP